MYSSGRERIVPSTIQVKYGTIPLPLFPPDVRVRGGEARVNRIKDGNRGVLEHGCPVFFAPRLGCRQLCHAMHPSKVGSQLQQLLLLIQHSSFIALSRAEPTCAPLNWYARPSSAPPHRQRSRAPHTTARLSLCRLVRAYHQPRL